MIPHKLFVRIALLSQSLSLQSVSFKVVQSPNNTRIRKEKKTLKSIYTQMDSMDHTQDTYIREKDNCFFLDGTPSVNTNKPCIEDFVFSFKDYCWYDNRFRSFCDWPKCHPMKAETLAGAGFHYTGKGDKVECDWCKLVLGW